MLLVIKIPPHVENVGRSVAVQFPRNAGRDLVRGEFFGREVEIPLFSYKRGEDLFALASHRKRKGEFVAVSGGISTGVPDAELDPAAVLYREILPLVPDSKVKSKPVVVFLPVPKGLAAAIDIGRTEIEVFVEAKVESSSDPGVDRKKPILAQPKGSEREKGKAVYALPAFVLRFQHRNNERRLIPNLKVSRGLRPNRDGRKQQHNKIQSRRGEETK